MKLRVILKTSRVDDPHQTRQELAQLYGIDYTDLIALALDSWDSEESEQYVQQDIWELTPLSNFLDPYHRVNRMFYKGKLGWNQYVDLNARLRVAVKPLREELQRTLSPLVQQRFRDQPVDYRFKGYLHLCDGMVVEIALRTP